MADNKATALKEAKKKYQLKFYYSGETVADNGSIDVPSEVIIDKKQLPYIIKCYRRPTYCHQFVNSMVLYHRLSKELGEILDAVIVNNKQREALDRIVDRMLSDNLAIDIAHEGDLIIDPTEGWD